MSSVRTQPELPEHLTVEALRTADEHRELLERVADVDGPVARHARTMLDQLDRYGHVLERAGGRP